MTDLQEALGTLAAEHKLPGAVCGVLDGDELTVAATGVCSVATGVAVTPDTLFQIGSITKVWTATMVMQLGVDLDAQASDYLPGVRFADDATTAAVTVRHLLTHTSGLPDADFDPHGRGDDCVARFVASLEGLPQLHDVGRFCSYCNTGFGVLGRLAEVLDSRVWDASLRERIIGPLGLTRTVTLPEEAIVHRVAVGHLGDGSPAPVWVLPRSAGPAGLIVSTAEETIAFARAHMDGGLLDAPAVREMQRPQTELPATPDGPRGLAWNVSDWNGERVLGHDGGTIGQLAFLRVVPSRRFVYCLLTNGYGGALVNRDLLAALFAERLGIEVPGLPEPAATAPEPVACTGTWRWQGVEVSIEAGDGGLVAGLAGQDERVPLRPVDHRTFLVRVPPLEMDSVAVFEDADRPTYAHIRGRLMLRA